MDKQDFLKKLHRSLRRTFTKQEIRDILADYEGFFISGANDGKSEEEICIELGDPEAVALELVKELPQIKRALSIQLKDILIIIITAALTFFGFLYYYFTLAPHNHLFRAPDLIRDYIILFGVFAIVLWLMLCLRRRMMPETPTESGKAIIILLAVHIFLLCVLLSSAALILNEYIIFITFATALCLAPIWKRLTIPKAKLKSGKTHKFILPVAHILLPCIALTEIIFVKRLLYVSMISISSAAPENIFDRFVFNIFARLRPDVEALMTFLAYILYAAIIIIILIAVISIYGFYRSNSFYFTLTVHAATAMNSIWGIYYILGDMADIEKLNLMMDNVLKFYFISIALILIFTLIIGIVSRKVKK